VARREVERTEQLVAAGALAQREQDLARNGVTSAEAQLADARLQTLRAQLQPHFLFNALNTISVLMHENVDSAERILLELSALLRRSLDSTEAHEVTLREEIGFLKSYLEIEQARFGGRLLRVLIPIRSQRGFQPDPPTLPRTHCAMD
jgi:LytS/YehU family sensor histidine kinase